MAQLYWGDGQAQLDEIEATSKAGKPLPDWLEKGRCHIMISIGLPNWAAATKRAEEVRTEREALLARLEGAS